MEIYFQNKNLCANNLLDYLYKRIYVINIIFQDYQKAFVFEIYKLHFLVSYYFLDFFNIYIYIYINKKIKKNKHSLIQNKLWNLKV